MEPKSELRLQGAAIASLLWAGVLLGLYRQDAVIYVVTVGAAIAVWTAFGVADGWRKDR